MRVAIIGAGISGISAARIAKEKGIDAVVFERSNKAGGLVKCDHHNGHLFHRVGGHVFNSKNQMVTEWFWKRFDKDKQFIKAKRNAGILLDGKIIGYPIENNLFSLDKQSARQIIDEILSLSRGGYRTPTSYPNFEAFLKGNFGNTLYELYFKPYNEKIWQVDLKDVSLEWLDGKLPMPNYTDMFINNIIREEECEMVHSTFYYPKVGGSQFIIDTISKGLDIECSREVNSLKRIEGEWQVNGEGSFNAVVYTGDVRQLKRILSTEDQEADAKLMAVTSLRSNGTSNLLCETDDTNLSWLYLPGEDIKAHRIIYTGNFSDANNAPGRRKSCVVEFSGKVSYEEMVETIPRLPGNLAPIASNFQSDSYVVQDHQTRDQIQKVKDIMTPMGFFLCGRFAEWEYYNMDKAIESAMNLPVWS